MGLWGYGGLRPRDSRGVPHRSAAPSFSAASPRCRILMRRARSTSRARALRHAQCDEPLSTEPMGLRGFSLFWFPLFLPRNI